MNDRIHFKTSMEEEINDVRTIMYASQPIDTIELHRTYDAYPFVPNDSEKRIRRCQNILNIQAQGLATRLSKIHCEHVVIGISGGLDSTLALLVCERAFQLCQYDPKNIHAISMPGFGTSVRTKTNADQLIDLIHASKETITIGDAVNQHFKDIHHDPEIMDITYENSQARERTQILMDLANQYNGIVIGTGDLSELALGWCTYNGDHMSMYAVNVSVPKTLVRYIVETRALQAQKEGLMDIFAEAGAVVSNPTCGACLGGYMGILAAKERCISTSNRNFVGRMGDPTSEVYLANSAVVAASAIAGKIVDPRDL